MKLNLGCGSNRIDGYLGVDGFSACKPDVLLDLFRFPWPWDDNSVTAIRCSHILEHVPHQISGHQRDGLILWMEECWRILVPNGVVEVFYPHLHSDVAFVDPTHTRYLPSGVFEYFNAPWRVKNLGGAGYAGLTCDFSYVTHGANILSDRLSLRDATPDERDTTIRREWNVALEVQGTMMAHKPARVVVGHASVDA